MRLFFNYYYLFPPPPIQIIALKYSIYVKNNNNNKNQTEWKFYRNYSKQILVYQNELLKFTWKI